MARSKQFAVLGLGPFGQSIVKTLSENGCEVLACDKNIDLVQDISKYATNVVQADITDEDTLKSLGLGNFDDVVVAIGSDLASNVMAVLIAKECGAKNVTATAEDMTQKKILEMVGADRVVLPEWEMGVKIAMGMISTNIIDFINLSDEYGIAEISPLPNWYGHSLHKANIRAATGITIVAIKRGKHIIISPKPDEVIEESDILIAVGENRDLQHLPHMNRKI